MQSTEKMLWEIRNEKNKAGVRWLILFILVPYLGYLLLTGRSIEIGQEHIFNWYYIGSLACFVGIVNSTVMLILRQALVKNFIHPSIKYLTMISDFLAVALVMIPTGGSESMFFVLNFVVLVSNGLRYGIRVSLAGTLVMNLFYIALISYQYYPEMQIPGIQKEILKLGGFWLVGIYTGYLALRFETLRGEVEHYQKLLAEALENKS
ncbi:MAG: hypothetical protein GW761_14615 [Leptospira sp.]|nr:hypothetical protein [Leptospira sp.]